LYFLLCNRIFENDGNHRIVFTIDGDDWNRGMFYGAFYTFVLVMNQMAAYYAAEVSILYNWQHFYVIMAVACFVLALIHWIFMHDKYFA
jgi:hypothetical protein